MRYAVVIPARYQSSRLPGKPLVDLCGTPMILRTYRRCLEAVPAELLYIATDDIRIRDRCEEAGANVIITSARCLTGTDRVAEAACVLDADIFINVQGDEPVFNPLDILKLIEAARANPGYVINGYCAIAEEQMFRSGGTPKVVMRPDGRLLYMSRAAIPTTKGQGFEFGWRQVCAYAFPRSALESFSSAGGKTRLEKVEDIEILRFLELGWDVKMIEMSDMSVAVDSPQDIARAESAIRALGLP